jgi:DNA-binding transcriptional LysR family regulator
LSFAGHTTFSDSFLLLDAAVAGQGVALGRARPIDDDLKAERLIRLPDPCLREAYACWLVTAAVRTA